MPLASLVKPFVKDNQLKKKAEEPAIPLSNLIDSQS
jgi:hypothetical protein